MITVKKDLFNYLLNKLLKLSAKYIVVSLNFMPNTSRRIKFKSINCENPELVQRINRYLPQG
ncbi:MAG: hypothetical protein B6D45_05645 [Ignavibacteriales bacterium UTCHB3]|jgi:hypothetical protein|nr:MAG: hypothetical protein B6D45_05645 [Ignavibacteriales bacterium UTCHB3]